MKRMEQKNLLRKRNRNLLSEKNCDLPKTNFDLVVQFEHTL